MRKPVPGLISAVALAILLVAPALADDEVRVALKMKDGRTLEGVLVSESKDTLILRMALGEVPVARGDVAEVVKKAAAPAGAPAEGDEEDAPATEERTILTRKDDSIVQGRATDLGDVVEVETELGTVRVDKKNVKSMRKETVVKAAPAAAPAEKTEARDEALGLIVTRPSAAWKFAEPPDPLVRIVMRREDPAVYFRVALAEPPDAQHREVEPQNANDMKAQVTRELSERFRAFRGLALAPDRYHGLPVWRASYQADTRVFGSKFVFRELRFRYEDADLVLQAYAPVEAASEALPEMEAALASFSFMGPIEAREDFYVHREAGFRLVRPRPDWKIAPQLMDPAVPVEVLPPDGLGRFAVEVVPAGGMASAQQAADAIERDLAAKSKFYRKVSRADRSLAGVSAVELAYQDFGDGTKLADVRRLVLLRSGRLVTLVASRPAETDAAKAAEWKAGLEALFAGGGFAPVAAESPIGLYRRGARAIELRVAAEKKLEDGRNAQAIQDLTSALDLAPNFGLAYVLRAKAYADGGDDKRALRDFEAASDLLDDPALGRFVAKVQNQQAKALANEDFPRALKLHKQAIQNDPQNRSYKEDLVRAIVDRARSLSSAGKFETAIAELRDALAKNAQETRYTQELVKAHIAWAQKIHTDGGDLYKARNVLKRGLKYAPTDVQLRAALERVEKDIKRKEEAKPPPKKGGGR